MKKFLVMVSVAVAVVFGGMMNASAMTKAELISKLTQNITSNGVTLSVDSGSKVAIEKYVNSLDLTSANMDYIYDQYKSAVSVIQANKVDSLSDLSKLSTSAKNQLKAIVSNVNANTPANVGWKKSDNGSVTPVLLNADNSVFAPVNAVTNVVKATDASEDVVVKVAYGAFVATVLGAVMVVRQVKKN